MPLVLLEDDGRSPQFAGDRDDTYPLDWVLLFEQSEEMGLADAQHLLNLGSHQQSLAVSIEQHFDLSVCEPLVQLSHLVPP